MSFFLPRKSNRCHQLMKLHPFFVLNRYITIIIIQKPTSGQYEIFGTGYDFTRHRVEFRLRAENGWQNT